MLGLADEVGSNDFGIGVLVSEDQAVGGAGEHVDADAAEQDALGFGDELIARPDQNARGRNIEKSERHRGHALHAAHGENAVGAADVGGVEDRRMNADIGPRRRANRDVLAAGDLGSGYRHDGGGDMAVAAAGHIAAGSFDGDGFLACGQTRHDLDLDIGEGLLLGFGEFADIVVGEADIVLELLRQAGRCRLDLFARD